MTPEQLELVKELFEAALERGPDDMAAFLIEATDDQDVRNEVESLLAAHELDSGFMNEPVGNLLANDRPLLSTGQRLGHL